MVPVFGDPVQHREARDKVPSVEQRGVLPEQGVDVGPGRGGPLHQPGVLPGLQRDQRLMARTQTSLSNMSYGYNIDTGHGVVCVCVCVCGCVCVGGLLTVIDTDR